MEIEKEVHPLIRSSADPHKVSLTIKGMLTGLVPLVLIALDMNGIDISKGELSSLIDSFTNVVEKVLIAFSSVMVTYGALRKVYFKYFA